MSETKRNPAIACGDMKAKKEEKGIIIEQGTYGPAKKDIINLAGMEIKVEGYEIILDEKSGKLLRVKDNHTIGEIINDKTHRKIMEAMKNQEKEGIEH